MEKSYKLNSDFAFSTNDNGEVNIINLGADDNVYVLNKVSAKVFPKLVEGENKEKIVEFIGSMDQAPSKEEIQKFVNSFVEDLLKLKIIEER